MVSLYSIEKSTNHYHERKVKSLPGNAKIEMRKSTTLLFVDKGTPRCTCMSAAFTLEAAVILPLLACFFVSILFFFRVMQVELQVQKALDDTGRKLAVYLCEEEDYVPGLAAAEALFLKEMSGREVAATYINGGNAGISLLESKFEGNEISLCARYHVKLPIRIFWNWDLEMVQRADCRKWNGWNGNGSSQDEDQWVYVTETGTVYHTSSSCTHLVLSIHSVAYDQVSLLRSENGEKYDRCLHCMKAGQQSGIVYITNQGSAYHSDLNCSGIKRTVSMVRLSEVGNRRACSRCGAQGE